MSEKEIMDKLENNEDQGSSSLPAEKIMNKLEEIEKKVDHIEELEEKQLKEEDKIEKEEEKELKELADANVKLQFDNIADWQRYIWQDCAHKKEVKESEEVDFYCEKRKGPCRFEGCPLNVE